MAFHDVSLPVGLQYGSIAGAGFSTQIIETASGHEHRVTRTSQSRHRFTLRKELQSQDEATALKAFALGRRGSLYSFRLKDWSDYTTAADGISAPTSTDQPLAIGDGSAGTWPLTKTYDSTGDAPYGRGLTLPVTGTVVAAVNGVATTSFTINGDGDLTLATPAPNGHPVSFGCEFDVPVRFSKGLDDWAQMSADAYQTWSFPDMGCIEVLDEVEYPERWNPGGGRDWGAIGQGFSIRMNDGKLQSAAPTTAVSIYLPPVARIPSGHVFTIHNVTGSAGTIQVRDDAGTAVGSTIANGVTKYLGLVRGTTTSTWVLY